MLDDSGDAEEEQETDEAGGLDDDFALLEAMLDA
jgi:hypothetical protein